MEMEAKKKARVRMFVIALILLLISGTGIIYWLGNRSTETTDNAQLDCNIIPLRSLVSAYIQTICFRDNERVRKGQVLFIFDTLEIHLRVAESEAALEIAEAKLESAKNMAISGSQNATAGDLTTESYEQNVLSARANLSKAQSAFDRITALLEIKAATQEQYENAQTALSVAKAEYAKAITNQKSSLNNSVGLRSLAKSETDQIRLAEAQVQQCREELLLAGRQLEYAVIKAPCDGIISKRTVREGQYVLSGQSLGALVENGNLWVTANFKETQLKKMKIGQKVRISIDAYPDLALKGRIESFSGATGAKYSLLPPDNSTGNFIKITQRIPVKIAIDGLSEASTSSLYPGFSVFVRVYTE